MLLAILARWRRRSFAALWINLARDKSPHRWARRKNLRFVIWFCFWLLSIGHISKLWLWRCFWRRRGYGFRWPARVSTPVHRGRLRSFHRAGGKPKARQQGPDHTQLKKTHNRRISSTHKKPGAGAQPVVAGHLRWHWPRLPGSANTNTEAQKPFRKNKARKVLLSWWECALRGRHMQGCPP